MEAILQQHFHLLESGSMVWGVGGKEADTYIKIAQRIQPKGWLFLLSTALSSDNLHASIANMKNASSTLDKIRINLLPNITLTNKTSLSIDAKNNQDFINTPSLSVTTTLNAFIPHHPAPNFLIIDDEGNEATILEGASTILSDVRATILCKVKQESENVDYLSTLFHQHHYHIFDAEIDKIADERVKFNEVVFKKTPYYTLAIPHERKHT